MSRSSLTRAIAPQLTANLRAAAAVGQTLPAAVATRSALVGPSSPAQPVRSFTAPSAPALLSASRSVAAADSSSSSSEGSGQGLLSSLLHGSDKARQEGLTQSHSTSVSRGKYVHEIIRHEVKPEFVEQYKAALSKFYPKLAADPQYALRLVGSWEVHVGDLDTFYHIWEYDGYAGFDKCEAAYYNSDIQRQLYAEIRPYLRSRSSYLTQEFAFWATSPPHDTNGGIYELRTYHLKPGHLLEWAQHWRRGLDARRKYVEPVGAWFVQIGGLHTVFHIWAYPSLEERKRTRDAAWQVETWNDTVSQTVKLIDRMHAQIMRPLDFSPLH